MIDNIIHEIELSLKNECFLAALSLALTLPDICGKAKYPKAGVGYRYITWFDEYIGKYEIPPDVYDKNDPSNIVNRDMPYVSGEIVYLLRNSVLHQGTPNIDTDSIKVPRCKLSHFTLIIAGSMNGGSSSVTRGFMMPDERRTLEINLVNLCCKICLVAKAFYEENKELFDFFEYDFQDRRVEGEDILWGLSLSNDSNLD